jgi:hypothetical protein
MGLFNFNKRQPDIVKGRIGFYGLTDWWLSSFNETERNYIVETFKPLGETESSLIKGDISFLSDSKISFLTKLASLFTKEQDEKIGITIINKAEELIENSSDVLDIHFLFQTKIVINYRLREKNDYSFQDAINACQKQIELSPKAKILFEKEYKNEPLPSHKGFEQLVIIEEKRQNYNTAIEISEKALREGWYGDWENRIERCKKKLYKAKSEK